jgi:DNA-binding transcriptional ArsR family regulator
MEVLTMDTLNVETLRILGDMAPEQLRAMRAVPVEVYEALAQVRPELLLALRDKQQGGRSDGERASARSEEERVSLEVMKQLVDSAQSIIGYFGAMGPRGARDTWWAVWSSKSSDEIIDRLLALPDYRVAQLLSVLGSEVRLGMLRSLLAGPRSAAELVAELQLGTTGQAYHHLRELERAGYVEQRDGRHHLVGNARRIYLTALALVLDAGAEAGEEGE